MRVLEELCALAALGVVDEAVRGLGMLLIPACRLLLRGLVVPRVACGIQTTTRVKRSPWLRRPGRHGAATRKAAGGQADDPPQRPWEEGCRDGQRQWEARSRVPANWSTFMQVKGVETPELTRR